MKLVSLTLAFLALGMTASLFAQGERERVVRADQQQLAADATWIYNDLEQGLLGAKATGKPLLVLIRCVP